MQKKVWIAIPSYTGTVHIPTARSVMATMLLLSGRGDEVTIIDEVGNAMIGEGRALLVARFLDSDATDLVFIDHDVVWEAERLAALIDAPVDLRVAVYPQRRDPIDFSVRWDLGSPWLQTDPSTNLLATHGAPAGFMVMSRGCLEQMTAHYTDLQRWCKDAPNETICGLFDGYWYRDVPMPNGKVGNMMLGEDFSFCQRWVDLGGKVWADPEIRMGHIGYKTFIGSLGDHLRNSKTFEEDSLNYISSLLEEAS